MIGNKFNLVNLLVEDPEVTRREIISAIKVYRAEPTNAIPLLKKSKGFYGQNEINKAIYANNNFYELRMTDLGYSSQENSYLLVNSYHLIDLVEKQKIVDKYVKDLLMEKASSGEESLIIKKISKQAFNGTLDKIKETRIGLNWQTLEDLIVNPELIKAELKKYGFRLK